MSLKLDFASIWREAAGEAFDNLHAYGKSIPPGLAATCPFTLDDVLDEAFTFDSAVRHMHATSGGNAPYKGLKQ